LSVICGQSTKKGLRRLIQTRKKYFHYRDNLNNDNHFCHFKEWLYIFRKRYEAQMGYKVLCMRNFSLLEQSALYEKLQPFGTKLIANFFERIFF